MFAPFGPPAAQPGGATPEYKVRGGADVLTAELLISPPSPSLSLPLEPAHEVRCYVSVTWLSSATALRFCGSSAQPATSRLRCEMQFRGCSWRQSYGTVLLGRKPPTAICPCPKRFSGTRNAGARKPQITHQSKIIEFRAEASRGQQEIPGMSFSFILIYWCCSLSCFFAAVNWTTIFQMHFEINDERFRAISVWL